MPPLGLRPLKELKPAVVAIDGAFNARLLCRENQVAFSRYKLLPRMLVDVSRIDTSCSLLGEPVRSAGCNT